MRRAVFFVLVLLAPLAAAATPGAAETHDLIVLLAPGAPMPAIPGAAPLGVVHGFVLARATDADEARLRARSDVLSVERAEPIARTSDPNLMLTRAEPAPARATTGAPFTGRGVTVAVVDSGIDRAHPDLAGRVKANVKLAGGKFVESAGDADGHGTHVAGIVAASGASSDGKWRGVAPDAELVGIDISERFTTASALLAYDWLYQNRETLDIRVVVNAWGRVGRDRPFDPLDAEIRAIDKLVDAGVVVLFSASNHGPEPASLSLEAQDPRVITVGAVDAAAQLMSYSSRGPVLARGESSWIKPDVVAPGDGVAGLRSTQAAPDPVADIDATHRYYSGTSQSVPHVGGIVALMLEANGALTPAAVQNALRESAIDLGAPGPDDDTGFGLVDAQDAVRRALGLPNDRGNVLVAGGVEAFEDEAAVAAPPPRGLLGLAAPPTATWSTTFPVKLGATGVTFDVSWSSPLPPVTVTLERDGAVAGSWTRSDTETGRVVLRGRLDDPEPGVWTLRAQGAAPVALEIASVVQVAVKASPERALDLDPRYKLPDTPAEAAAQRTRGALAALPATVPIAVPAGLGVAALAGVLLVWRPRRARVVREPVLEPWDP